MLARRVCFGLDPLESFALRVSRLSQVQACQRMTDNNTGFGRVILRLNHYTTLLARHEEAHVQVQQADPQQRVL